VSLTEAFKAQAELAWLVALPRPCPVCYAAIDQHCVNIVLRPKTQCSSYKTFPHQQRLPDNWEDLKAIPLDGWYC